MLRFLFLFIIVKWLFYFLFFYFVAYTSKTIFTFSFANLISTVPLLYLLIFHKTASLFAVLHEWSSWPMFFMKIFSPSESIHGRYASWVSFLSAPDASHRAGILRLYFFIEVKVTYSKLLSVQFGKVDIFYPCESITTITIINTCIDGPQSLLVTIGNLFSLTLHL